MIIFHRNLPGISALTIGDYLAQCFQTHHQPEEESYASKMLVCNRLRKYCISTTDLANTHTPEHTHKRRRRKNWNRKGEWSEGNLESNLSLFVGFRNLFWSNTTKHKAGPSLGHPMVSHEQINEKYV